MKSVTEFANVTLNMGLKAQAALTAEGKSPEDVQTELGTQFKYEGEKLTHFVNALGVAAQNAENLRRVVVISLNEGEKAPAKATQVEAHHYVPEFLVDSSKRVHKLPQKDTKGGGKGGRGGGKDKESPWGLSPEQKAAKKAGNKPQA